MDPDASLADVLLPVKPHRGLRRPAALVARHGALHGLFLRRTLLIGPANGWRGKRFLVLAAVNAPLNAPVYVPGGLAAEVVRLDLDTIVLAPGVAPGPVLAAVATVAVEVLALGPDGGLHPCLRPPIAGWRADLKRAIDLVGAAVLLVLLAPVLLLIAAFIKLDSPGPVLFRQHRYGFNRQVFALSKFRTMGVAATDAQSTVQTSRGDVRLTRLGRVLRRHSLDELPQLLDILRGDMSFVGPRPHALGTTTGGVRLADALDTYVLRARVPPGITGWAQVNGSRGELSTMARLRQRVAFDLHYIEHWSLALDLRIMLMTVRCVIYDGNAY